LTRLFMTTLLATGGVVIAAGPAHAGAIAPRRPIACDPNTYTIHFDQTSSTRTVTNAQYISIPKGGSGTVTRSVQAVSSITASVTYSSSASISANIVIGELSGTVGLTLALSGSFTGTRSESVTVNVGPGHYAFFRGVKKFRGTYSGWKCNSTGSAASRLGGTAVSYAVPAEGAASCGKTYSPSSYEYKARVIAC
jgi:hypothetical protein